MFYDLKKWDKHYLRTERNMLLNPKQKEDFYIILEMLRQITIARFKWKNVPIEVPTNFFEIFLLYNGKCVFWNDDVTEEYFIANCLLSGNLNAYGIPNDRTAILQNGTQIQLTKNNIENVVIFDNESFNTTFYTLTYFAKRITMILESLFKNIELQKNGVIFTCNKDTRLSIKNLVNNINNNMTYITIDDLLSPDSIKPLNLQVDYKADKLYNDFLKFFNLFLSYIGVENFQSSKMEREVSSETKGNDGLIESMRNSYFESRKRGVEKINKMFGLNIEVEYNSNLLTEINIGKEVLANGEIYDNFV